MQSTVHLIDCLELMAQFPDKHFDLAVVDPPYGIGIANNSFRQKQSKKNWDKNTPEKEYFIELFRISKNQIIWGGITLIYHQRKGF